MGAWFQLLFAVVFVLGLALSWRAMSQPQSHGPGHVPPNLGEMELLSQVTGSAALVEIAKLHGKGIEMADGYMAEYGHGRSRVTVWVGVAASEVAASGLLKQMVDRIAEGNPAFRNLRALEVGGRTVYTVEGSGGEHFFYGIKDRVVWLTIRGAEATTVIKDALKTF